MFGRKPSIPNDDDGDALRRLIADGSVLERPMTVDFHVAAPDEPSARAIGQACTALKYHVDLDKDEGSTSWTVTCTTRMVLSHPAVVAVQDELQLIAKKHGGKSDGWGSFGNA